MAQIKTRRTSDGSLRHTAYIRIKKNGVIIHQESRTFPRPRQAAQWGAARELEIARDGLAGNLDVDGISLGALIDWYVLEFQATAKWARTKASDLSKLRKASIAEEDAFKLTSQRLIAHVRLRRKAGAGPATVLNDLVWIGVVLRAGRAVRGLDLPVEIVREAREACGQLRLVAKSKSRDRTPTYDELHALDSHFARQDKDFRSKIPMRHIMWFAVYSSRRESEITRLQWVDQEEDRRIGLLRDAKHPDGSEGNHRKFRYTNEAWQIMEMQPLGSEFIFPYNPRSIGDRFTDACKVLGIDDLHFHDLRHEATTRLFELGLSIPEVATYTLHESWSVLKRYTSLVKRGRLFHAPFLQPTGDEARAQLSRHASVVRRRSR
jgi:integrase